MAEFTREHGNDNIVTGRQVLWIVLAFFGGIFAVNGVFLYHALKSYSGVVSNEPYRKGLAYNERIAADEAQRKAGWRHRVKVLPSGEISVTLKDKAGEPLTGMAVAATFGRPSTSQYDRQLELAEVKPGLYRTTIGPVAAGNWLMNIEARRSRRRAGAEPLYRAKERLWLKP